jgi:hypothetical protein
MFVVYVLTISYINHLFVDFTLSGRWLQPHLLLYRAVILEMVGWFWLQTLIMHINIFVGTGEVAHGPSKTVFHLLPGIMTAGRVPFSCVERRGIGRCFVITFIHDCRVRRSICKLSEMRECWVYNYCRLKLLMLTVFHLFRKGYTAF